MVNSNEGQTEVTTKTTEKPKKDFLCKLPLLALISSLIALIFALFTAYTSKNMELANEHLKATILHLEEEQANNKTIDSSLSKTQASLQNQLQTLNKNFESTLKQQLYQKNDWLLLRARYYLELAQINAHWSGNQEVTIALLQQADKVLHDIAEQKAYEIRQAIAKELAQFKTLAQVDIPGILSQLDAAQNTLVTLPIKQPFSSMQNNPQQQKTKDENASWHKRFKQSMNVLEKLVIIRRNDSDTLPLISPLHQTLIRDSIGLNLQQAEWAILQNNPAVYQLALTQALTAIKRTFDENTAATQALIKQLEALKQVNLISTKPVIEESLSLLNQWIEAKKSPIADSPEGDKVK